MGQLTEQFVFLTRLYYRDGAGVSVAYPGLTFGSYDFNTPVTGGASGVPNSTYFEGRLRTAVVDQWGWANGGTRGPRQITNGAITIENSDGAQDSWANFNVYGSQCFLIRDYPLITSGTLCFFLGKIEQADVGERDVTFRVRDDAVLLDVPANKNVYAGTNVAPNGIEGTPDTVGGQRKPSVYGTFYGFTPPCVNTSKLIYQVDGQRGFGAGWTLTVKDMGWAWSADPAGNYTSQSDMETNAPAAGMYRVWPAQGCFRLGSSPAGAVTVDGYNPVLTSNASPTGGSGDAMHHIVDALVRIVFASMPGVTNTVNGGSSSALPSSGIVVIGDETILSALNRLAAGAGYGWRFWSPDAVTNQLELIKTAAPSAFVSGSWMITDDQVAGTGGRLQARKAPVQDDDHGIPVWRVNVRYKRNHTVLGRDQLSGILTQDQIDFAGNEWRVSTASDSSVLTAWPNAPEIWVDSLFVNQADADALSAYLLAIYKVQRLVIEVDIPMGNLSYVSAGTETLINFDLGRTVPVQLSRYGLSAGKGMLVIGTRYQMDAGVLTVTLWG